MYKAYRLQINDGYFDAKHIAFGRHVCSIRAGELRKPLSTFMMEDGNIDGGKLSNTWFPEVPAQVFISHSHADTELAYGWLGGCLRSLESIASSTQQCGVITLSC